MMYAPDYNNNNNNKVGVLTSAVVVFDLFR